MRIREEVTDYYCDQMNGTIIAIEDDRVIGYLDWQEYGGITSIAMIEVDKDHRRQGVGTALVKRLYENHPGRIQWGMMTEDGAKLRKHVSVQDWFDEHYKAPIEAYQHGFMPCFPLTAWG